MEILEAIIRELKENNINAIYISQYLIASNVNHRRVFYLSLDGNVLSLTLWPSERDIKYDISNPKFTFNKLINRIKDHLDGN